MFASCANALLAGKIICPVTEPKIHEFLCIEKNLEEMNAFFSRIDRAVSSPAAGGSFLLTFAAHACPDEQARLRELRKRYVREIDPVIRFIEIVLRAEGSDNMLQAGEDVRLADMASAISQSEALSIELQTLVQVIGAGRGEGAITNRLQSVLKRLETWGYLKLIDAEREIYRVTGKIDVFQELTAFLIENIPGAKEEVESFTEQGTML